MRKEIYEKIIKKKDFSQLPKKDVEKAFQNFEKRQVSDEEKIRLTRDLLRKVFSAFISKKILSLKDKEPEWVLRKHISTRERLSSYPKLYSRILKNFKKGSIIDLGAGINGFSYRFFKKNLAYVGIEGVGQLVNLMNHYFDKQVLKARAIHMSLFEIEEIKKIITKARKPKIIFLFKTLDSLEMLERNYSKKLLREITPLVKKVVISFATRSLIKKTKFRVKRTWILEFIRKNFRILDDFELGNERYIIFDKNNL